MCIRDRFYDDALEEKLLQDLRDPRVAAIGEVGLDYHYEMCIRDRYNRFLCADVAQLVEHHLAKVRVAGSNPVVRSMNSYDRFYAGHFFVLEHQRLSLIHI